MSYRIQSQYFKNQVYFTSNKKLKWKCNESNVYHNINNIKYLGTNLSKDIQDMYAENYKTLVNEISGQILRYDTNRMIH